MKKTIFMCLVLPLFLTCVSSVHAQHDLLTVKPDNTHGDLCGFVMTIANHNSAAKNIDEVDLTITSTTGNPTFINIPAFSHWTPNFSDFQATMTADNGGITPNNTLTGLGFAYTIDAPQLDNPVPVTIFWVTKNSGEGLDSGTISPICTGFQSFTSLDVASVITSQSGGDPGFTFTMQNKNSNSSTIYNVIFELQNQTGGTLRPSKITPATGWTLDSVTTYKAYFHTDNNPIVPDASVGGWTIFLRANPAVNKFNFVWSALEIGNSLIDRDTLFNISNTATSSSTDSDSLSVKAISGCIYNVTLKNYHLSNQLPPSRIVKLVLKSKTAGVTFESAPSAPLHWTKTLTADSIVYLAPTLSDGIPDGIVSANQFSFSVTGSTTSDFSIGWDTYKAGATFPTQVSPLTSGTVTTKCTVLAKTADVATNSPGLNECDYKLNVSNSHNIKPPSNLTAVAISIPANSGQLIGLTGPPGWSWTAAGTTITCKSGSAVDNIPTGSSQDFFYTFVPKTSGANVTATWTTTDDQSPAQTTGTGTYTINCSPITNICDTFAQASSIKDDSCIKSFNFTNRKTVSISQLSITATNGWTIESSNIPSGWTRQAIGLNQIIYTATDGFAPGAQAVFQIQFANFYPDTASVPPSNNFFVDWTSTDSKNAQCHDSLIVTPGCLARPFHVDTTHQSVNMHSDDIGVANFTIVPNPTHGAADISFDLHSEEQVVVTVYDLLGNQISVLNTGILTEGSHHIPYTMSNVPDGIYYIRMQTRLGVISRKLILTK